MNSRINYWKIGGIPRIVFAIFGICFYENKDNNLCYANEKIIDIKRIKENIVNVLTIIKETDNKRDS